MTSPFQNDDPLAPLFLPAPQGPATPLRYRSGLLTAWNVATGENTVSIDGESFQNLTVLSGSYLGVLKVGDVVSLMSTTDARGITTYALAGIAITPPDVRIGQAAAREGVDSDIQALSGNVTSTSYTNALSAGFTPEVVFRTMTGKVLIHWGAYIVNSTSLALSYMSFEVREGDVAGAGSIVSGLAADDARAVINRDNSAGGGDSQGGWTYPINGLVPGAWYNAQGMYRVSAGTGTFLNRTLIADPK